MVRKLRKLETYASLPTDQLVNNFPRSEGLEKPILNGLDPIY